MIKIKIDFTTKELDTLFSIFLNYHNEFGFDKDERKIYNKIKKYLEIANKADMET